MTISPAAAGNQLVRVSLPLPQGFVHENQTFAVSDGHRQFTVALRPLTWYPASGAKQRFIRRGLVGFPYTFGSLQPVRFQFRPVAAAMPQTPAFPVRVNVNSRTLSIVYEHGPVIRANLIAPPEVALSAPECETVETNGSYLWQRFSFHDSEWPRVIDVRVDVLGGVLVEAHLQRQLPGNYAPEFGWDLNIEPVQSSRMEAGTNICDVTLESCRHTFSPGQACDLVFDGYRLYSPTAPWKRSGYLEVMRMQDALHCRYLACTETEKVPMQLASWRRAEFVVAPKNLARLTAALESPHRAHIDWSLWDHLYSTGKPLALTHQPDLAALLHYHHEAMVRSAAVGPDWGNVTSYTDGAEAGGAFGMNRLNHCAAIFEEGYRSGDQRLVETAVLWCQNFYDQSIWWGPRENGGTRYNNIVAMGQTPPAGDRTAYMWRSTNSVSFCTKGFDAFFYTWEQTGDPRMKQALEAQVAYAVQYLHAGRDYTRNVGDVRDFLRLYRFTREERFLEQAKRLFGELRTQLSTRDLFTESGKPIAPAPPFIVDDAAGYQHPFAKPYIIGYALEGLPELARLAPHEPKLPEVVRAVADFLAETQDPLGGWRYPHPRSPNIIMSQALEHAWQLVQADRFLGPNPAPLDAIERVLRQRLFGWRKTGKMFSGLTAWEIATGKVKQAGELTSLYQHPADRDFTRDYSEGRPDFGSAPPEGLVYFPEVLAFYLEQRPASRLLRPPSAEEPLGKVLSK